MFLSTVVLGKLLYVLFVELFSNLTDKQTTSQNFYLLFVDFFCIKRFDMNFM